MDEKVVEEIVLRKLKSGLRLPEIHKSTHIPFKIINDCLNNLLETEKITHEEIKKARQERDMRRKKSKKSNKNETSKEEQKIKTEKNRIITISGEPVSGKGTVVSKLKKFYEESGYKVDVINTGSLFRKAALIEYKKIHPEIENPLISNIEHDPDFADKLEELDRKFDTEFMPNLVKDFNEKAGPNEILIIDSRLAWRFIPDTFDIRLTVDSKIAGERVFNDKKRGKEDQFSSLEDAINLTEQRKQDEIDRYKKVYGIDLTNENNYDLIINTSFANPDDVVKVIEMCIKCASNEKDFCKMWASPKTFYPSQKIGETYEAQPHNNALTLPEMVESIKKNGIYPDEPVYCTTRGNSMYKMAEDGNHRVYGCLIAGFTLVPYKVIKHIEKETVLKRDLTNIYDHEELVSNLISKLTGKKFIFRYDEYPKLEEEKEMEFV